MAKFLDTQAISNELMKLIKDSKEKIILVSPYLKVNTQIQERLKTKSKIGTLSEIVIVYGKSELKKSELDWIKEIEDLKVYEKGNLHAKCYISEDRAIICSMNLYDYSQQNNIEMGILITKQQDVDAYTELIDEINNIKVNGTRRKFNGDETSVLSEATKEENLSSSNNLQAKLSPLQILKMELLKGWRLDTSRAERSKAYLILTDNDIRSIVRIDKIDQNKLYEILPKKNVIKYGYQILEVLKKSSGFTIGKVLSVSYQDNPNSYDKIKLKDLTTGIERWYDTTQELPVTNTNVAVMLNNTWFNQYFYIKEEI